MEKSPLIAEAPLAAAARSANRLLEALDAILLGHHDLHQLVLIAVFARGHILLEGLPGVGKTALVKALSTLLQLDFRRIQFTPDLMPSDILGTNILQERDDRSRAMVFHPGPVFTNLLLADEINRASPKTQSAMLEAMQEAAVTLLGETRRLPEPFFVLASQNPIELEGTYPIPEAQLDRFMFKLTVDSVPSPVLSEIISARRRGEAPPGEWRMTRPELEAIFAAMEAIYLARPVADYIARLVAGTAPNSPEAVPEAREYLAYGASPRAAIAIAEAARAAALCAGRPAAGFDDVRRVAPAVLNHRLILNYKARMEKITPEALIAKLFEQIDVADLQLPTEVKID